MNVKADSRIFSGYYFSFSHKNRYSLRGNFAQTRRTLTWSIWGSSATGQLRWLLSALTCCPGTEPLAASNLRKKKGLQDEGYVPMRETINRWTKKNKQCNKKDNNVCRLLNYSTRNWTQVDILLEQGTGQRTDQWLTEDYPCKPDWRLSSKHFIFREKKLPFIPKLQSSIVSRSSGPLAIVTLGKNQTTIVKPLRTKLETMFTIMNNSFWCLAGTLQS